MTDLEGEWWYRTPTCDQYGPYDVDQLRRFAVEGRIDARGMLRQGESGDWCDPGDVLALIGEEFGGVTAAPPVMRTPPVPTGSAGVSSLAQTTYILLGLLPFLLVSIGGIHNLVAGRVGAGVTQLVLSMVGVWGFGCAGAFTGGVGFCVSVPLWMVLLIWVIVDVATVRTDGSGRRFTS